MGLTWLVQIVPHLTNEIQNVSIVSIHVLGLWLTVVDSGLKGLLEFPSMSPEGNQTFVLVCFSSLKIWVLY